MRYESLLELRTARFSHGYYYSLVLVNRPRRSHTRRAKSLYAERRACLAVARACIASKDGTRITVEGTPEEVARIIEDVRRKDAGSPARKSSGETSGNATADDSWESFVREARRLGYNRPFMPETTC